MMSKTFAAFLLVTSMKAFATVAYGMGGGGGGAAGGGSAAGGSGLPATTGVAIGTPSQPTAPIRRTQQKARWR